MFQSFEVTARPEQGPPRLAAVRAALGLADLDGFIVPRADAHQGEYVAARDERLAWLTGFTGSAGFCIVLKTVAGVFIDGRYRTQVKAQVDLDHYTPVPWPETKPGDWLITQLPQGGKIGFDPWLYSAGQLRDLERTLQGSGIGLVRVDNLVDRVWEDQPPPPTEPATIHPISFAGEPHEEKRARVAQTLLDEHCDAAVLTLPDSVCWLLNIRGADNPRSPILQSFANLHSTGAVDHFGDPIKVASKHIWLRMCLSTTPQNFCAFART